LKKKWNEKTKNFKINYMNKRKPLQKKLKHSNSKLLKWNKIKPILIILRKRRRIYTLI